MSVDLCNLTLEPLRSMLDNREISAKELVDAHIERLKQIDSRTKALAIRRFEAARREALAADRLIARGEGGPLTGIPCTVKEFIGIGGLPQTGGIKAYEHRVATRDSPVTRRLRDAGAIIIATTNIPEGGLWMECDNPIYGVTRNPWDPTRSPGGSSGGEAVAIAAGGAVFGIGSDIGGSIRIPAGMCGAIAHKPSGRLVPTTDHFPPSGPGLAPLLSIGPFARCVEDLDSVLRIIAGPDGECPVAEPQDIRDYRQVDAKSLRVLRLETPFPRLHPTMRAAVHDACNTLASAGATIIPYSLPAFMRSFEIWGAFLAELSEQPYAVTLGGGTAINPVVELVRFVMGRRHHTPAALLMTAIERATGKLGKHVTEMAELGRKLRTELNEALEEDGILIFPPYTMTAPRLYEPLVRPLDATCTPLFNVCESAVSVVPVGMHGGLPLCVQLVAAKGHDHVSLAAASILESAHGGWTRAPSSQLEAVGA